jgi:hypothetical protein
VSVVFSVGSIALASLRFQPKPSNATRFTDVLHGRIRSDTTIIRGLISMAGNGTGKQKVLVRADLLFASRQLLSTWWVVCCGSRRRSSVVAPARSAWFAPTS